MPVEGYQRGRVYLGYLLLGFGLLLSLTFFLAIIGIPIMVVGLMLIDSGLPGESFTEEGEF